MLREDKQYTVDEIWDKIVHFEERKEDADRHYFVEEVFAVSCDLIPNSQRGYFYENAARKTFATSLREYFYYDLNKLYYDANRIKSAYRNIESYPNNVKEYTAKAEEGNITAR